jgi:hypothetical protein
MDVDVEKTEFFRSFLKLDRIISAALAQSVKRLGTGWTIEGSEFESR